MNINIVRGGVPLFTRDVAWAATSTPTRSKELDLSFEVRSRLKKGDSLLALPMRETANPAQRLGHIDAGNPEDL